MDTGLVHRAITDPRRLWSYLERIGAVTRRLPPPTGNERESASRGVPVCVPAFAGSHCAYPRRDGQAELAWVVGYIPRWFTRLQTVTHPSTNRARR